MRLKESVSLKGIQPETVVGMMVADSVYSRLGAELRITSATDGKHMKGSLHPKGKAFDCGTKGLLPSRLSLPTPLPSPAMLQVALQGALGPQWDVVLEDQGGENEHIHVEFQPHVK